MPVTTKQKTPNPSRRKGSEPSVPVEQKIADQLIAAMEQGKLAWRRPWDQVGGSNKNILSGHCYSGSNLLLTKIIADCQGWLPYWITFQGARQSSMQISKGSKATYILKPTPVSFEEKDDKAEAKPVSFIRFSTIPVFNICQVEDCDAKAELIAKQTQDITPRPEFERHAQAEQVLNDWEVKPTWGGDCAFYMPSQDKLCLPERDQFHTVEDLYSTWAHEVIHSTGHKDRLARDLKGNFGCESYAKEELIAELGSLLLCSHMEIGFELTNHASYLQSWIKVLKEEPKFIMTALSKARKAADLVFPFGTEV